MDLPTAARFGVLKPSNAPYLAPLVYGLTPIVADSYAGEQVPVACVTTDGHLIWSTDFLDKVAKLPRAVDLVTKIMAHEVVHCLLGHVSLQAHTAAMVWVESNSHYVWEYEDHHKKVVVLTSVMLHTISKELAVNTVVDDMPGLKALPWYGDPPLLQNFRHLGVRMCTSTPEWLLHLASTLPRRERRPGEQPTVGPDDVLIVPGGRAGTAQETARSSLEVAALIRVTQKAVAAHRGSVPAALKTACGTPEEPKIDWRTQLRDLACAVIGNAIDGSTDYSYRRPARRQGQYGWGSGIRLPGRVGSPPRIAFIIDTSGSMSSQEIRTGIGEVAGVLGAAGGSALFISADCAVSDMGEVWSVDDAMKLLKGGGGTDFAPAIAEAVRQQVDAIVYFTDGWGSFGPNPGIPVIWLSTTDATFPWGTVIKMSDL